MNKEMEKILELSKMFEERERIMPDLREKVINHVQEAKHFTNSQKKQYAEVKSLVNGTIMVENPEINNLYKNDREFAKRYFEELKELENQLKAKRYDTKHKKRTDEELDYAIEHNNAKINGDHVGFEVKKRELLKRQEELLEIGVKGYVVSKYLEMDKSEYKKIIDSIPSQYKGAKQKNEFELPTGTSKSLKDITDVMDKNLTTYLSGYNNFIEEPSKFSSFMKKIINSAKEMIGIEMPNKLGNLLNEKAGIETPENKQKNKYTPTPPSPTR